MICVICLFETTGKAQIGTPKFAHYLGVICLKGQQIAGLTRLRQSAAFYFISGPRCAEYDTGPIDAVRGDPYNFAGFMGRQQGRHLPWRQTSA